MFQFPQFFSVDSNKAIKAQEYGWLNAINYMAPARSGGVGNLCGNESAACALLCLGIESGQAAMVSKVSGTNAVRESRKRKARYFMKERAAYMTEMFHHIARNVAKARRLNMRLAVRPNGSTDLAYEGLRFFVSPELAAVLSAVSGLTVTSGLHTVFSAFPTVQFVDYTKNPKRFDRQLPANYHLTFSRSETNEDVALALLARGVNVAVVFAQVPAEWRGFKVIDGDKHDLRHLDPRGERGFVIGLLPKGNKCKRDTSGFVVR
jgi:hypothetical protein